MRFNAGRRIYSDNRVFTVTTTEEIQSIIPDDKIDRVKEAICAISIIPNKDCSIIFEWNNSEKNKEKKYPKELKANKSYSFVDIDFISDVIFTGEIGTEIDIAIGI